MKPFVVIAFLLSSLVSTLVFGAPKEKQTPKECLESTNYDLGFNHAKNKKDLATPELKSCPSKDREKLVASYRNGFKEALGLSDKPATAPVQHAPVQVVINAEGDGGYLTSLSKCSDFKKDDSSCFTAYDGDLRSQCEVCREGKSCFISLNGKARAFCEAYIEKKSCFISFSSSNDRSWCEHFQAKKSCDKAFFGMGLAAERGRCERGEIPRDHFFWLN